jgi:hypothetical protein
VVALMAILAAVAGGNLAVTVNTQKPRVGHRVYVRSTGQVDAKGRYYVFRNRRAPCGQTARSEAKRGVRLAVKPITESFDLTLSYKPRVVRREWICAYLYSISCDAAGNNCGAATGLPPDAGFAQVRIRVRPASQSVNSAAGKGRVIT